MQGCNLIAVGLVFASVLHVHVLSRSIEKIEDGDLGTNSMTYLGTIDGKSFYYEKYPQRTWFEARDACNASNMNQTSFTSECQAKFLNELKNMPDYTGLCFWTAGRDTQLESQFLWDVDNSTASSQGLTFKVLIEFQTCLDFVPYGNTNGHIRPHECSGLCGTLCKILQTEQ